ncbi:hypothetical protein AX16_005699 [Volvariella volvacea WC 439]|nr:hypothetical protein AX16_005699 [Volvariella volvacea WC 439]
MAPIHIGFVGLSANGWAAAQLANPLFQPPLSSSYKLVAVSTTNAESAAASAKKYSEITGHTVKAYHGPADAIANDQEVDLVVVSIKVTDHKQAVLTAIEAGKDVFVEWPAGVNLDHTQEIADAAKKKGVKVIIGTQGRQALLKSILESGKLGRVLSTTVSATLPREINFWGPTVGEKATYVAAPRSGASFLDVAGGHFIEAFTYALGSIASLSATTAIQFPTGQIVDGSGKPTGKTIQQENPDQFAVQGTLARGAVFSFHFRSGVEARASKTVKSLVWTIDFEQGAIRIESDEVSGSFINIYEPRLFVDGEEIKLENPNNETNVKRAWEEYAKGEEGVWPTIDDGLVLKKVLDAIIRSAETGQRINL